MNKTGRQAPGKKHLLHMSQIKANNPNKSRDHTNL